MVILKNCTKFLDNPEFFQTFLQNKEPSCILYSKEGKKFNIHKEILYQSNLMKNVLISSNNFCCRDIEIFCPCTEEEVRQMVNFLYTGTIGYCCCLPGPQSTPPPMALQTFSALSLEPSENVCVRT